MKNQLEGEKLRLNNLDFYKGIAIILVVITHYAWTDEQRLLLLFPFHIDMAVPVFMVITGYVTALSFNKRGLNIETIYKPREIICKWLRFLVPFLPIFAIQIVARMIIGHENITIIDIIKSFIQGGIGPGSYYFPVMIQVVVLIPLMWFIIEKYEYHGLIVCFVINVVFEGIKTIINMDPGVYRLCSLRYTFLLAYGLYLYSIREKNNQRKLWYLVAGFTGIIYIFIFNYTSVKPIITAQWTTTSVFAVLFIVPIMMYLLKKRGFGNNLIELFGKASFNIFLVQMIYYWSIENRIGELIPNIMLRLLVNIMICCGLGVIFYFIENPITQRIVRRIRK